MLLNFFGRYFYLILYFGEFSVFSGNYSLVTDAQLSYAKHNFLINGIADECILFCLAAGYAHDAGNPNFVIEVYQNVVMADADTNTNTENQDIPAQLHQNVAIADTDTDDLFVCPCAWCILL